MIFSVLHPDVLNISDETAMRPYFGGDQEWYADEWHRRAGCGPTCAANVTAYLAWTRPSLRNLYAGEDMRKSLFSAHMEEMYKFVTPGNMGLNRVEMYTDGVAGFSTSRGLSLQSHTFEVHGNMRKNRAPVEELAEFVEAGLTADCPIAFLNLNKGRVKNIQAWHWITITSADISSTNLSAYASDEGDKICFDLRLWYLSTHMRGGLIYFTEK